QRPCTGCRYCQPCPEGVVIPEIFQLMNYYKIYGLIDFAKQQYKNIGKNPDDKRKNAFACVECKKCENICPQKIKITDELKKIHEILADTEI
ncbi:MAG: 4Fe-4S dicluster domain-containing protein, partial [Actinobacteria bacterium]|nr:4Fe-4S dicluster domain-containing protein [Actinomycetota bacterium]